MTTLTYLGAHRLTVREVDEDYGTTNGVTPGHWVAADCDDYDSAVRAAGGLRALHVWAALTDHRGQYGDPQMYTLWGSSDGRRPVAAELVTLPGDVGPGARWYVDVPRERLVHRHAVFMPDEEGPS